MVERQEGNQVKLYGFSGTGNFNEETAKTYSDCILFTSFPPVTGEIAMLFDFLEDTRKIQRYDHLLVSPYCARDALISMINIEIENAKKGLKAHIHLKLNSLIDRQMVYKLYEASQNGVEIKLIVRGICSLVMGVGGSE